MVSGLFALIVSGFSLGGLQNTANSHGQTSQLLEHSVSLFTGQECPKISMTSNPRQNCRIGQPFTKKWVFFAKSAWTPEKTQGEVGGDQEPPGDT